MSFASARCAGPCWLFNSPSPPSHEPAPPALTQVKPMTIHLSAAKNHPIAPVRLANPSRPSRVPARICRPGRRPGRPTTTPSDGGYPRNRLPAHRPGSNVAKPVGTPSSTPRFRGATASRRGLFGGVGGTPTPAPGTGALHEPAVRASRVYMLTARRRWVKTTVAEIFSAGRPSRWARASR